MFVFVLQIHAIAACNHVILDLGDTNAFVTCSMMSGVREAGGLAVFAKIFGNRFAARCKADRGDWMLSGEWIEMR